MKKTNFQFYATHHEISNLINQVMTDEKLKAYYVRFFPEYEVQEFGNNTNCDLSKWTFVIFSEDQRKLDTEEDYDAYAKIPYGDLILYVGKETTSLLTESSIGAVSDNKINPRWDRIIRTLRKQSIKGAYIVTGKGFRQYYPKIMYLPGAQTAYFNGKVISPFSGGYHLELLSDNQTSV